MYLNFSRIKSIFICLLVVLAVYLTNRLWFEDSLNHSFFYSFLNTGEDMVGEGEADSFGVPWRLVLNFSDADNKLNIDYSNIAQKDIYIEADKAVTEAVESGQYEGSFPVDYSLLLEGRSVIFEYAFYMPSDIFSSLKGQRTGQLSGRFEGFNSIIIAPDDYSSNIIKIYFIDLENNEAHQYLVKNVTLCDNIKNGIQLSRRNRTSDDIYYISSRMAMGKNFYFPEWLGEAYDYSPLKIKMNYYSEDVSRNEIEKNINLFFDNPSAKWYYMADDEVITYSDSNIAVKYYDTDILEYSNYKMDSRKKGSGLLQDYAEAISFLKRDTLLGDNEYYLAGYKEDDNIRYFYFDFVFNNFPVFIDFPMLFSGDRLSEDEEQKNVEMEHGIEITVEDGTLVNYKKLCYNFEKADISESLTLDIISHMNDMDMSPDTIDDVTLGYYLNKKYDWIYSSLNSSEEDNVSGENTSGLYYFIKQSDGALYKRSGK